MSLIIDKCPAALDVSHKQNTSNILALKISTFILQKCIEILKLNKKHFLLNRLCEYGLYLLQ